MEAFECRPFSRERLGFALVRLGRFAGGFDQERQLPDRFAPVRIKGAPQVSSRLTVLLTDHSIERYGERTGRFLDRPEQIVEITRIWRHVVVKTEPPEWLEVDAAKHGTCQLFGEIADMVFVMVPHEWIPNCFIATTVISNDRGRTPARIARAQARRKSRRRKKRREIEAIPAPGSDVVKKKKLTPSENRRAILGSLAALALAVGPVMAFVFSAGRLGISNTFQVLLFFSLLAAATKAYLVLSDRFTRTRSEQSADSSRE